MKKTPKEALPEIDIRAKIPIRESDEEQMKEIGYFLISNDWEAFGPYLSGNPTPLLNRLSNKEDFEFFETNYYRNFIRSDSFIAAAIKNGINEPVRDFLDEGLPIGEKTRKALRSIFEEQNSTSQNRNLGGRSKRSLKHIYRDSVTTIVSGAYCHLFKITEPSARESSIKYFNNYYSEEVGLEATKEGIKNAIKGRHIPPDQAIMYRHIWEIVNCSLAHWVSVDPKVMQNHTSSKDQEKILKKKLVDALIKTAFRVWTFWRVFDYSIVIFVGLVLSNQYQPKGDSPFTLNDLAEALYRSFYHFPEVQVLEVPLKPIKDSTCEFILSCDNILGSPPE
jgi:hypothetical protein